MEYAYEDRKHGNEFPSPFNEDHFISMLHQNADISGILLTFACPIFGRDHHQTSQFCPTYGHFKR